MIPRPIFLMTCHLLSGPNVTGAANNAGRLRHYPTTAKCYNKSDPGRAHGSPPVVSQFSVKSPNRSHPRREAPWTRRTVEMRDRLGTERGTKFKSFP